MPTIGVSRQRWSKVRDLARTQLWPLPVLGVLIAVALGIFIPKLDRTVASSSTIMTKHLSGGATAPESAQHVLTTIAGSLVTVTSLTFSLTVVTLQLASSQYSPRLLRTFARDRFVHATLALLVGTFTYALVVMPTVRSGGSRPPFVPHLALVLAFVLALVSVVTVVVFLAHLAREIRVESLVRDVHTDCAAAIQQTLGDPVPDGNVSDPAGPSETSGTSEPPMPPSQGSYLCARSSGFLTSVNERALLAAAVAADAVIFIDRLPGDSLVADVPIGMAWPTQGTAFDEQALEDLAVRAGRAVRVEFERTPERDIAFGLRQLVDVVLRALSPALNDPTTAIHALSHASALLCDAVRRDLGPRVLRDENGTVRAVLRQPDFATLLDLVVSQPLRSCSNEPRVLARLLMLLREVAWVARRAEDRAVIRDQLARLRDSVEPGALGQAELAFLVARADLVEQALTGSWPQEGRAG